MIEYVYYIYDVHLTGNMTYIYKCIAAVNRRFVHALKYGSTILFKFKVRYKDIKIRLNKPEGAMNNGQSMKLVLLGTQDMGRRQKKNNKQTKTQHNTEN